ncbi:MAG: hypothetical protein Q7V56_16860 [Gammaproteobacteria bacterium]|nr:hypothetical protein [Gammaproteobacteria bacterium]
MTDKKNVPERPDDKEQIFESMAQAGNSARGLELIDKLEAGDHARARAQRLKHQEKIRGLRGRVKWEGNLDQMRGGD